MSSVHQSGAVCWNRCLVWEHRPDKISVTVGLASSCRERRHCCTSCQLRTEMYKCVSKYCILASCFVVFISACTSSMLIHYKLDIYLYIFRPFGHHQALYSYIQCQLACCFLNVKKKNIRRNILSVSIDQCREGAVKLIMNILQYLMMAEWPKNIREHT